MKKVLLIIESCNPEWASVPLVGYHFYSQIMKIADVTLVTHVRNKPALLKAHPNCKIRFIEPGFWEAIYYRFIVRISTYKGRDIWPLRHALQYPLYFFFDKAVRREFGQSVSNKEFDIVHALTPMMPRYPVEIIKDCKSVSFVLGPVNGGVPFPPEFKKLGRKEFSQLNFLRTLGAYLIPNYRNTYKKANLILAGSSYTRSWIVEKFDRDSRSVALLYENAVSDAFYQSFENHKKSSDVLRLLFVGRLVPYKGADMLIKAMADSRLIGEKIALDIVGSGSEMESLKKLATSLGVSSKINFVGWVPQSETAKYYQSSDVFCFPSVREFGGAVVMEAMASGLPCIVVDNGGIGEYVTPDSGYKIAPRGEGYVIMGIAEALLQLIREPEIRLQKSNAALKRAQDFSWQKKGEAISRIYEQLHPSRRSDAE